jgi:hypothetical protein
MPDGESVGSVRSDHAAMIKCAYPPRPYYMVAVYLGIGGSGVLAGLDLISVPISDRAARMLVYPSTKIFC